MTRHLESKAAEEALHLARLQALTQQCVVCWWWGQDQPKALVEVALKYRFSLAVSERSLLSQTDILTCAADHR